MKKATSPPVKKVGRPKSETADDKLRATFVMDKAVKRKLNVIKAYTGMDLSDMLHDALTDYIAAYEKKNGPIPVK